MSVDGKLGKDWTEKVELFDKVIVEEAIEDGVSTGGGDSNDVADQEGQHHVLCNHYYHIMLSSPSLSSPVFSKTSTASVTIQNRLNGSQLEQKTEHYY